MIDITEIAILPHAVSVLHISCSLNAPLHSIPPFDAGVLMLLICTLNPIPQVLLHADQAPHSSHWQSTKYKYLVLY